MIPYVSFQELEDHKHNFVSLNNPGFAKLEMNSFLNWHIFLQNRQNTRFDDK
jgi:hypothetical protein